MSSTDVSSRDASQGGTARTVDTNLEVIVIPVSDVDRAKTFYRSLGWRLDADRSAGEDFRLIQFTPPGSGCAMKDTARAPPSELLSCRSAFLSGLRHSWP